MKETYKADLKPELSLYEGLLGGNLSKSIVSVTNQIDMIPTDWTLSLWIGAVEKLVGLNVIFYYHKCFQN